MIDHTGIGVADSIGHGARQHTAFVATSRASSGYPAGYHADFVIDPNGINIEAVFRRG